MEVVLPTGDVMKTGAAAMTDIWWAKPDPRSRLAVLRVAGTTGMCTKMSIEIYPKLEYNERAFILCYRLEDGFDIMRRCRER